MAKTNEIYVSRRHGERPILYFRKEFTYPDVLLHALEIFHENKRLLRNSEAQQIAQTADKFKTLIIQPELALTTSGDSLSFGEVRSILSQRQQDELDLLGYVSTRIDGKSPNGKINVYLITPKIFESIDLEKPFSGHEDAINWSRKAHEEYRTKFKSLLMPAKGIINVLTAKFSQMLPQPPFQKNWALSPNTLVKSIVLMEASRCQTGRI